MNYSSSPPPSRDENDVAFDHIIICSCCRNTYTSITSHTTDVRPHHSDTKFRETRHQSDRTAGVEQFEIFKQNYSHTELLFYRHKETSKMRKLLNDGATSTGRESTTFPTRSAPPS